MDASIKQELEPREVEQDLDSRELSKNEIARKKNREEVENLLKEEAKGELIQMEWVRWEEEELLPEGWSYRWHKQRSLKSRSGFKRSLHFITDAGTKLKSSNEAFKYLVENDFPELDQEKMREFVQSWKNTERRNNEVETVKKEMLERADEEELPEKTLELVEENNPEEETAEEEAGAVIVEEEVAKRVEEEKREERRSREREGQRRRRALAKARRMEIKEEDLDISDDNHSRLEEHGDTTEKYDAEEEHLDEDESAGGNDGLRESKYEVDPLLPLGWTKATYILQRNGRALPRFKAPDGTLFGSRAKVGFPFSHQNYLS